MRFTKEKEMKEACIKNTRKYKQKFLWLPLTIDGETRWLEEAHIVYRVNWDRCTLSDSKYYYWEACEFVNK
jgi:hypothetical protein